MLSLLGVTKEEHMADREVLLVTGSSGFLGHAMCHHFGSNGYDVIGFDNAGPPYPPPNTDGLFCDLTDDESLQKTFHIVRTEYGRKIKAVIHLAAYYSFSGEDSPLYKKLTVDGTGRLLRELENFDVGQIIFSSSMLVHKPNEKGALLTEDSPIGPTWAYPKSKVETEKLLAQNHGRIPVVILRIAGVYDNVCHSIPIAHQIQRIYEDQLEAHLYPGDLEARQSFVHVNDVVSACQSVIDSVDELPPLSTFLIGEPEPMSYEELQKEIGALIYGSGWTTLRIPKPIAWAGAEVESLLPGKKEQFIRPWMIDRASDNFELDITRAALDLGWMPRERLSTTLPKMIEGLKMDPLRFYKINKLHPPKWLLDRERRSA